jgi:hypothetical protein
VTVHDHPERVKAAARGRLAARLVPKALELACLVHGDGDAEAIGRFLGGLPERERAALPVILAALVDVDRPVSDLLAYVTWDEFGCPLPGSRSAPGQVAPGW